MLGTTGTEFGAEKLLLPQCTGYQKAFKGYTRTTVEKIIGFLVPSSLTMR